MIEFISYVLGAVMALTIKFVIDLITEGKKDE